MIVEPIPQRQRQGIGEKENNQPVDIRAMSI